MAPIPEGMIALQTHEQFESLLRPRRPTEDGFLGKYMPCVVICFSATWCGPCRRIDKKFLVSEGVGTDWYHCDVDENEYTLGYCGGKSIPSFVCIKDGLFKGLLEAPRDAEHVLSWVKSL